MNLKQVSKLLSSMNTRHVFVEASQDGEVTYVDVSFGTSEDADHAWHLFVSAIKRLGILWEPRCDANGNWGLTSDVVLINFGPYDPKTSRQFPKLIVTTVNQKIQAYVEKTLFDNAITVTKYVEPNRVLLQ